MKEDNKKKPRKAYKKPSVRSENLMSFGALCNGTGNSGGRKTTTFAPDFCNGSKLLS